MPKTALITDSTCDIPSAWIEQFKIQVVPLTINFGSESFLDGVEMTALQFYERLGHEKIHPTTSQPSPAAFLSACRKAAEDGAEQILCLTISSGMSGTIDAARQAAAQSPIPVTIHDSRNNSMGLGWQVIAAARAREAGADLAAMLKAAEAVRDKISYYITLNTIDFLAKGGRIADAVRFLNSILQIKPIIYVKPDVGTVGAALPSRSRRSAIEGIWKEFFNHARNGRNLHVTVLHNNALEEAQALAERLRREYNPVDLFIQIVSPVLGVHTGPGALALCGYTD